MSKDDSKTAKTSSTKPVDKQASKGLSGIPQLSRRPIDFLLPAEASQCTPRDLSSDVSVKADALLADPNSAGVVYVTHCSHGSHNERV